MQAKLGPWKLCLYKGESLVGRQKGSEVVDCCYHRPAVG